MKTSAFVVAASAALVAAQDIKPYIPECAVKCLQTAASSASTCKLEPVLDGKCLCDPATFEKIFQGSVNCVVAACGADTAVGVVLPGTKKYCEDALAAPPPASSSSAPPPASSSSKLPPPASSTSATLPPASTSTTAAPTSSGAASTTMAPSSSAASSSGSKPTSGSGSGSGSGNGTAPTGTGKPTSAPVPAGASSASAGFIGLVAAVAFGIFGLL